MAINRQKVKSGYGLGQPLLDLAPEPIVALRNPTGSDLAQLGATWVNSSNDSVYVLTSISANSATWTTSPASGAIVVASMQITGGVGNQLVVDQGNVVVSAGNLTLSNGNLIVTGGALFTGDVIVNGDFDLTTVASVSITSTNDAARAIYLRANGGTSETIELHSDQGTGVASVFLNSDVGGVTLDGGVASVNAVNLTASDAAGGMTFVAGTGGIIGTITNGPFTVTTGTGAVNVSADATDNTLNIGTGAGAKLVTAGSATGASSLDLLVGTGNFTLDGVAGSTYDIGATTTTGTITIGGTVQTGLFNLATGTGAQTINVGTGGTGVKTINVGTGAIGNIITVGSATAAASLSLLSGSGDIGINSGTGATIITSGLNNIESIYLHADSGVNETIRIHADQGTSASSIDVQSDVGGIAMAAGGALDGIIALTATSGGIDLTAALQMVLLSTEAVDDAIVINASDASGGVDILTGGGQITLDTGDTGNIDLVPGTGTAAAAAVTLNSKIGVVTLTGQTTASGAQEAFTITNSEVSATSGIIVTMSNVGTNDARMTVEQVKPAAGSFVVNAQNNGAAALNGDVIISWIVLN